MVNGKIIGLLYSLTSCLKCMMDVFLCQVFGAPSFADKIMEVVAVFGTAQMAASRVINLQHHRIAQVGTLCSSNLFLVRFLSLQSIVIAAYSASL